MIVDPSKLVTRGLAALVVALVVFQGVREARGESLLEEGEAVPPLLAPKLGGGQFKLEELKGRPVMLDFWATWCKPCQAEMPDLIRIAREYRDRGLVFVAADRIETDHPANVGVYMDQVAPDRPDNMTVVFADEPTIGRFKAVALPTLYLISPEGKVVEAYRGLTSEREIRAAVERTLKL